MSNLDEQKIRQLLEKSKEASKFAYAPFSKFPVGAALCTADGRIFTGCNVENSSYGLGICAERVAAVKAVSQGAQKFSTIAVYAPTDITTYPCGACRQFLYEFGSEMEIYVSNGLDTKHHSLKELLPFGFKLDANHR